MKMVNKTAQVCAVYKQLTSHDIDWLKVKGWKTYHVNTTQKTDGMAIKGAVHQEDIILNV